jgi:putative transposase
VSLHCLDLWRQYIRIVATTRQVRIFPGGVYDLRLHVAWCPECRRAVPGGEVAARPRELTGQKAAEHRWGTIAREVMPDQVHLFVMHDPKASASYVANQFKGWSKSYFAASAGAVSAETVRRYTGTRYERPWRTERSR